MQNKVLPIVLDKISSTLGTEVTAKGIDIDFFEEITLTDVYIQGNQKDTLVQADILNIDISIFSYFDKTFFIDDLKLSGANINLTDRSGKSNYQHIIDHLFKKSSTESSNADVDDSWNIGLDDVFLDDVVITQTGSNSKMNIVISSLSADLTSFPENFDTIAFDNVISNGLDLSYIEYQPSASGGGKTQFPSLPIMIKAKELVLKDADIVYDKSYKSKREIGFDTNHINMSDTRLSVSGLEWGKTLAGKINTLSFSNKPDWELLDLKTELYASETNIQLEELSVETLDSKIAGSITTNHKSFDELINDFVNQNIEVQLSKSKISKVDISYFVDRSALSFINIDQLEDINYSGRLKMKNGNLNMQNTNLSIGNKLDLDGNISFDLNGSNRYSAQVRKIKTTQRYLNSLLPSIMIPKEIKDLGKIAGSIDVEGDDTQVEISQVNLLLDNKSIIQGKGQVTRLDQSPDVWMDFYFDRLYLNPSDVLQGEAIPSQVYNMGQIDYIGSYTGNTIDINMDGILKTDIGDADVDASIVFQPDYSSGKYNGDFDLDDFDLGALLEDDTFGKVTASGSIDGEGFDTNTLNANVKVKSKAFDYKDERYEDIEVNGIYKNSSFTGRVVSKDDKLNLNFDGTADLNGENSEIEFSSEIDRMDLTQFGLGDSLLWISGILKGKFRGDNIDNINGRGTIEDLKIGTKNGTYSSDSTVTITVVEQAQNSKKYSIQSSFIDGTAEGNIKLSQLPTILEAYVKNYIPIAYGYEESVAVDTSLFDNQKFAIDIRSKDLNPLLEVIMDDPARIKEGYLKGNFSSEDSKIDFKGNIDSLSYKGYVIENGNYFFDGRRDFINGNIILDNISDGKEILIHEANINTSFNNKVANITTELFDENDEQTLLVGSDVSRTEDYVINFHDTIIINQSVWEFSPYNEITYGEFGFYMQDVSVSKGEQAVTMYTDENESGQAIEILMDNFILSELTSIIGKENEYFEGEINGSAIVNNIWSKPFVTADLAMKDIMLQEYAVGVAKVKAIQDTKTNIVVTKVELKGPENDATLDLTYGIGDRSINGYLDMKRLEINTVDPFLTEILSDSEGSLVGRVNITGTPTEPVLNGKIDLVGVQTTPVFTNSRYAILDQTITVDEEAISFGDMVIVDVNNNIANLTGQILHTNLSEMYLDMNIDTDKFLFLNTTAIENDLFYGNVTVEADVSIQGPIEDINIDGTAVAIDNSNLSVSPFSVDGLDYETDFIIYADPRKISLDSLNAKAKAAKDTYPFDVDLKLTIEEDSKFEMIMNPITGDNITGQGRANLIFNLKKTGEMDLFGNYVVTSGKYLFTYGLITKEFDIQEGGTVTFNGNPLEGILDVEATYQTNTAVYDLLYLEEPEGFSDAKKAETKRRRPINVVLNLANSISKPEITMDIQQVEQSIGGDTEIYEAVDDRLNILRSEPDELNKQVFGLLILDNFIASSSSDPNFAQTGANIAFSSLSSLVTSQLNSLTEGLIKGVELNFDVNSYSSDFISTGDAGLVTELGVGVSKKLFNDRLTLSAGTNVDLESSSTAALFNNLAGDFIIAYQLTEDGKINMKIFRKSNYTTIGDENASKNGVGINYRKEFGKVKKKTKN